MNAIEAALARLGFMWHAVCGCKAPSRCLVWCLGVVFVPSLLIVGLQERGYVLLFPSGCGRQFPQESFMFVTLLLILGLGRRRLHNAGRLAWPGWAPTAS
jgi:hypothetical protein